MSLSEEELEAKISAAYEKALAANTQNKATLRAHQVLENKCYKGQRRGSIKAQKEILMVFHVSAVDYSLHFRCLVFSVVKKLV